MQNSLATRHRLLPTIRDLLKSRKSNAVEAEFLKQMEDKAKVEINTEATQMLMDRLDQFYPKALGGAQRVQTITSLKLTCSSRLSYKWYSQAIRVGK